MGVADLFNPEINVELTGAVLQCVRYECAALCYIQYLSDESDLRCLPTIDLDCIIRAILFATNNLLDRHGH